DVVRFAESEGYEYDRHLPDAWRYRDYVIDSLNADKPFDRFLTEQLAGDELDPSNPELQVATTFHRLGPVRRNAGNPDIALSRNEVLTERTDILGTAILGLTVGCARCHNHKLEPILQKDYYRLQAYLAATDEHNISLASAEEQADWEVKTGKIKDEMKRLQELAKPLTGLEREKLEQRIADLEDQLPAPLPTIPGTWNDFGRRTAIHVLRRGVWENKAEAVGPRPLSVLWPDDAAELPADESNPRTQLAAWLTVSDNPLTSRVAVNRLWQGHFGLGIVKSANDFGVRGDRPSHPELHDWLAAELVAHGWSQKRLHRLMVTSSVYRQRGWVQSPKSKVQGSESNSTLNFELGTTNPETADPENRLLSHFTRRRLSAEELRDAMLAASGRLNLSAGGVSVMIPVEPELVQSLYKPSQWQVAAVPAEHHRRSIYLIAKRNLRLPFFETFDAPALTTSCARRDTSTHAPQALELLNGRLSNELAAAFAERLAREADSDPEKIVERAFWLALGRAPTARERALAVEFLRDQPLREFALAMFNLNGFLYVP
ncbi:MAG: DUF1549 and DUF1553 domain-containing protein, partial [Pirellulaceae bacterium]|nr:DUF1549 and DUF1553 domain-containing protein [Pirellulaceae bacterium]